MTDSELLVAMNRISACFEKILTTAPVVIYVLDLIERRNIYVNRQVYADLGYCPEEIWDLGDHFIEKLMHPDDIVRINEMISRWDDVADAQVLEQELRLRHADGTWHWLQIKESVFQRTPDGRVQQIIGISFDKTQSKLAEEQKKQAEASFQQIFFNNPLCMWVYDLETLAFLEVNQAAIEKYGYTREEFLAMTIKDIRPSEDIPAFLNYLAKPRGELRHSGEWRHCLKDGSVITIEVTSHLLEFNQRKAVLVMASDITEQKKTSDQLKLQSAALEAAANAIVITNRDGVVEWVNAAFANLTGYASEEVIGNKPSVLKSGEHPKEFYENLWRSILDGKTWRGEIVNRRKDGALYYEEMTITPVQNGKHEIEHFIAIKQDITERKRVEKDLERREKLYRLLAENMADVVWVLDPINMKYKYVSPSVERLIGYTVNEIIAQPINHYLAAASWEDVKSSLSARVKQFLQFGKDDASELYEVQQIHKNGSIVWVEVTGTITRNDDGEIEIIGSSRDITQRKQTEVNLKQVQSELYQAQKLESIGRLAGGIAHDLNNALVPIIGYSELLAKELPKDSYQLLNLRHVLTAADRAAKLVRQILAFSRKQIMQLETLNLNEVISDFAKMLNRLIGEDIAFQTRLSPHLYPVKADKTQLEQVLMNLAVNARDAMPDGGNLMIETTNVALNEQALAVGMQPGDYVLLSISDTGHGMDEATQQRIFEPFYTTKESGKGTGLGLSTVFGIVKQHNGDIRVYSEPGVGTVFNIYLPAWTQTEPVEDGRYTQDFRGERFLEGQAEPVKKKSEIASLSGKGTILVVEDENAVRELIEMLLKDHGYEVYATSSPQTAIEMAKSLQGKLDLLLTDVIIPEMNGKELFLQMTQFMPALKVIYISGYTDDVIARHGVLEESVNFIQKPFNASKLLIEIRDVIARKN
ncbi:MAG: PAS domain S-box protein [Acidobacteriota bacterium]